MAAVMVVVVGHWCAEVIAAYRSRKAARYAHYAEAVDATWLKSAVAADG